MNEKKETQPGPRGLQRESESEGIKKDLRQKIEAIRRGHFTGGYCETDALQVQEKKLDKILRAELKEAVEAHGYSPDPRFKHQRVREIEVELNGLSWKPLLVVKED